MIQATVTVLRNDFPAIAASLPDRSRKAIGDYATGDLLPQARENQAPHIDTKALNDSGEVLGVGSDTVTVKFTGGALNRSGEPRTYAAHHEYGTRFTGAYPFLTPAVYQTLPGLLDHLALMFEI